MPKITAIGLDIAKNAFHAHGADERGATVREASTQSA